jgi:hypothetical protein
MWLLVHSLRSNLCGKQGHTILVVNSAITLVSRDVHSISAVSLVVGVPVIYGTSTWG